MHQHFYSITATILFTWGNKVFSAKMYLSKHAIANIVYANEMHEMIKKCHTKYLHRIEVDSSKA